MAAPFTFLTVADFERLDPREKLAYLSDAMVELRRSKGPEAHGWDNLFAQPVTQQQQQEQAQPEPDPESGPEARPGPPEAN